MNVIKFLSEKGIDTIDRTFYRDIALWTSWYKGYVSSFHSFRVYNGKDYVRMRKLSMQMAKKVCEDYADLLMNEHVQITVCPVNETDTAAVELTEAYVKEVLERNHFDTKCNQYQERKGYTGTVAYVAFFKSAKVDDEDRLIDGVIGINYVSANNIYPISWENGEIYECAFVFNKTIRNKKYAHIQAHMIEDTEESKEYVIRNYVCECTNGSYTEIKPEKWGDLKPFASMSPEIRTGSDRPQFVIDRPAIVNNSDDDDTNPMGMSIFANSLDTLKKIDDAYDSFDNEFRLGRKRIFVSPDMLSDLDGNPTFDANDTTFYMLPEDTLKGEMPIKEVNMELRAEEHSKSIQEDINYLSMKVGFGTGRYKFENGNIETATQVISENSDMYRTLTKNEKVLGDAIKGLIMTIIHMGNMSGKNLIENVEIKINFDDSIIEDKKAQRDQDMSDVAAGIMKREEYRAKWYGETLEEAAANLPVLTEVIE